MDHFAKRLDETLAVEVIGASAPEGENVMRRHSFQSSKSNLEILVFFGIGVPFVGAIVFGIVWLIEKLAGI